MQIQVQYFNWIMSILTKDINSVFRRDSSFQADLFQHSSQVALGRIQNYQPFGSSSSKYLATRRLIRISRDGGKDRTKRKTSYTGQKWGITRRMTERCGNACFIRRSSCYMGTKEASRGFSSGWSSASFEDQLANSTRSRENWVNNAHHPLF